MFEWDHSSYNFTLAADQGLEIREKRITRDDVYICDEAFFTGTAVRWCL